VPIKIVMCHIHFFFSHNESIIQRHYSNGENKFVSATTHISVVQRSTCRKTNVEVKLGGWSHMLITYILITFGCSKLVLQGLLFLSTCLINIYGNILVKDFSDDR